MNVLTECRNDIINLRLKYNPFLRSFKSYTFNKKIDPAQIDGIVIHNLIFGDMQNHNPDLKIEYFINELDAYILYVDTDTVEDDIIKRTLYRIPNVLYCDINNYEVGLDVLKKIKEIKNDIYRYKKEEYHVFKS